MLSKGSLKNIDIIGRKSILTIEKVHMSKNFGSLIMISILISSQRSMTMNLGSQIKYFRQRDYLSQEDLAERLYVSR